MNPLLKLDGFGVGFADKVILADITLSVPDRGITVLVGPAGAGKSTVLRTLAGHNDAQPLLRTWGSALFNGAPLGNSDRPALVAQKARLFMASVFENLALGIPNRSKLSPAELRDAVQATLDRFDLRAELEKQLDESVVNLPLSTQRRVAIARTAAGNPRLLFVDEASTGLDDSEMRLIQEILLKEAEDRAVMVVTHNQNDIRGLGGNTALLAGGRIIEFATTEEFLENPQSEAAKTYVRTGSCSVPSPEAKPEDLAPDEAPPPELPKAAVKRVRYAVKNRGPRGFHWVKRGLLAGTPRPGLIVDLDLDLDSLKLVEVNRLVNLEETVTVEEGVLQAAGIAPYHFPIDDMKAPDFEAAAEMCALANEWMSAGEVVAYHCRAGLGRTGTMLAAQLIWEGEEALVALESIRLIQSRWVQSQEQVDFLEAFEKFLAEKRSE